MSFTPDQIKSLEAKLDGSHVKQREQVGRKLSYLEGWHVIAEANRIFGFDGWNRETVEMKLTGEPYKNEKGNWVVGYWSRVRVVVFAGDHGLIREGSGFGSGIDRDLGRAHESALKEAETDSMKRALATFGNVFGLALYDKTQENVEHNGNGHAPSPPPPPAPKTATSEADTKRARFAKIKGDLQKIDNLDALDAYMDGVIGEISAFPREGFDALKNLYHKRREAVEIPL